MMDSVTAVVCLGFPLCTVEGIRGEPDDNIYSMRCPTLFVIGQNSATTTYVKFFLCSFFSLCYKIMNLLHDFKIEVEYLSK